MLDPFFILGNPRSGTTLLRLMLATHRDLVVPPECGFAVWLYPKFGAVGEPNERTVVDFASDVYRCRKFETWNVEEADLAQFLVTHRPHSYAAMVSKVYECYGGKVGKTPLAWGDKNNFYLHHIGVLDKVFPQARFIHIVRDGRDVACSYLELSRLKIDGDYSPRLPSEISEIAREWVTNVTKIRAALGMLAPSRWTEVRFRDLVLQTQPALERLSSFLGVAFDPEMLRFYLENARRTLEPVAMLRWKEKTLHPVQPSVVDRYKKDLTAEERRQFEIVAADLLGIYGFETEAGPSRG